MKESRAVALKQFLQKYGMKIPLDELLDTALTHPTYAFEQRGKGIESNQRLEFLGDALLGLIIGEELYRRYPEVPEGDLTKMRAALVCETTLAEKAFEIQLGNYLLLGRGEEMSGGRSRPSTLADAFEALLAAIYLESGFEPVRDFVLQQFSVDLKKICRVSLGDFKTNLQEIIQKKHGTGVTYRILEESGPDHDKRFLSGVFLDEQLLAKGKGHSKKEAEQKAAQLALAKFIDG